MHAAFDNARALYKEGRFLDCLELCENILAEEETHAATLNLVGLLCYRAGDTEAAEAYFRQCLEHDPRHAEAQANLALMLKRRGCLTEALECYRRSVELNGCDGQAQFNYGLALLSTGKAEEAAVVLRQAAHLAPYLEDVHRTLGTLLMELGLVEEAIASFRNALTVEPNALANYRNLAVALYRCGDIAAVIATLQAAAQEFGLAVVGHDLAEMMAESGDGSGAIALMRRMLALTPPDASAWESLGTSFLHGGRFAEALVALQHAVSVDEARAPAHMRIFAAAQILEQRSLALDHQRRALAHTRLFSETGGSPQRPTLLILKAPGDWQVNLPTDFIIRREAWRVIHTYYVDAAGPPEVGSLPSCDIILNALGEADLLGDELAVTAAIERSMADVPFLNAPAKIACSGRDSMAEILEGLAHCVVPTSVKLPTAGADHRLKEMVAADQLTYPFLIRPTGTHCGEGMVLVGDAAGLDREIKGIGSEMMYATQFVDYRSPDGLYRKFRVAVVDGRPLPYHMAISKRWMVHYYNAELDDHRQMDREEENFLADFENLFGPVALRGIAEIHRRVGLDIYALDCALAADGRLILFEVAVNAIIHLMFDPQAYAYKFRYVPRIFDAVQSMMDARMKGPFRKGSESGQPIQPGRRG